MVASGPPRTVGSPGSGRAAAMAVSNGILKQRSATTLSGRPLHAIAELFSTSRLIRLRFKSLSPCRQDGLMVTSTTYITAGIESLHALRPPSAPAIFSLGRSKGMLSIQNPASHVQTVSGCARLQRTKFAHDNPAHVSTIWARVHTRTLFAAGGSAFRCTPKAPRLPAAVPACSDQAWSARDNLLLKN